MWLFHKGVNDFSITQRLFYKVAFMWMDIELPKLSRLNEKYKLPGKKTSGDSLRTSLCFLKAELVVWMGLRRYFNSYHSQDYNLVVNINIQFILSSMSSHDIPGSRGEYIGNMASISRWRLKFAEKTRPMWFLYVLTLSYLIRGMEGLNSTSSFLFTEFNASNFSATIVVPVMLTMQHLLILSKYFEIWQWNALL